MKRILSTITGLAVFTAFAATSGAFASVQRDEEPVAVQRYQCTINWKAGSDECKSQGVTTSCTSNYQGDHESEADAKERCESFMGVHLGVSGVESCNPCWLLNKAQHDCLEHCKDLCYKLWEKCRDNCPRKDRNCLSECTNELAKCNRECDRKCR